MRVSFVYGLVGLVVFVGTPLLIILLPGPRREALSQQEQARRSISRIELALERFRADYGSLPVRLEDLRELRAPDGRSYLAEVASDPWGRRYHYDVDQENRRYRLRSAGQDGRMDTIDDLKAHEGRE